MSDEEKANMSARIDKAMLEIGWMCQPFLDPCSDFPDPPPMDLSVALVNELGLGFMFPEQSEDTLPNPAQTMQPWNVAKSGTPMLLHQQGKKRKEYDESNENFQNVQLDVERQARRPIKRVKSVHSLNFQNNDGAFYLDAAYNSQQGQRFVPQVGDYQSTYSHGRAFGGPALYGGQPPPHALVEEAALCNGGDVFEEHNEGIAEQPFDKIFEPFRPQSYPVTPFRVAFSDRQPSVGLPYIPTPAAGAQTLDIRTWEFLPSGPAETISQDDMQAGQTLRRSSPMSSPMPPTQPPSPQARATRPRSRADRGHIREPLGNVQRNHRYHPYANSKQGSAQSTEAPQAQQFQNGN